MSTFSFTPGFSVATLTAQYRTSWHWILRGAIECGISLCWMCDYPDPAAGGHVQQWVRLDVNKLKPIAYDTSLDGDSLQVKIGLAEDGTPLRFFPHETVVWDKLFIASGDVQRLRDYFVEKHADLVGKGEESSATARTRELKPLAAASPISIDSGAREVTAANGKTYRLTVSQLASIRVLEARYLDSLSKKVLTSSMHQDEISKAAGRVGGTRLDGLFRTKDALKAFKSLIQRTGKGTFALKVASEKKTSRQ